MCRLIIIVAAILNAALGASAADQPNVVLILADDLGYADVGCYGSQQIKTPHVDRIAREGVRFTDCYSAAPVCSPTRAALITGQYPARVGFDWVIRYTEKDRGLPATPASLPKQLAQAGYATGLFGKWHLGYRPEFGPNAHGFQQFLGFLAADLDYYSHRDANGDPGLYENEKLVTKPGYLTDLLTDRSVAFIKQHAKQPFFLEVAYNAPHWPFQRPGQLNDERTKENYGLEHGTRADYVAMVEQMDDGVGKILAALDRLQLTANTLVVFTSDNGGERLSDNSPFFHGKYSLWEGGLRVPCVVRLPATIPKNTTSSQVAITMDLTATFLAVAGCRADNDGEDLLPILSGRQPTHDRTLFWRLPRPDAKFGQKAVRRGSWKWIEDREVELLFDLAADPGERKTRAADRPDVVKELRTAHAAWEKTIAAPK